MVVPVALAPMALPVLTPSQLGPMPELVATVGTPAMVVLVAWPVAVQALLITARMAMVVPPVQQATAALAELVVLVTSVQRGLVKVVLQVAMAEPAVLVAMAH